MFNNVLAFTAAVLTFANQPINAPQKREIIATEKLFRDGLSIIAHRGGALEGRENSLSAIQQAAQIGVHGVMIDVRITKDNKFVLCQDANLQRLTGQNQLVADTDYADIGPYLNTIQSEFGESFTQDNSQDQEKPPKIEEVLQEMDKNALLLFVNAHFASDTQYMSLLTKIKNYGLINRTVLVRDTNHAYIRNQFGESLVLMESVNKTYKAYQAFLDGSMRTAETISTDIFNSPYAFKTIKEAPLSVRQSPIQIEEEQQETLENFVDEIKEFEERVQIMNQKLQEKRVPVVYWLANHQEDFDKAIELNANAIITDRPAHVWVHMAEQKESNFTIQQVSSSYSQQK